MSIRATICAFVLAGSMVCAEAPPGQRIFGSNCAGCHGLDARGGEHAPAIRLKSESELTRVVRDGRAGMPSFARTLDREQIRAVVEYVRTLQGGGDPQRGRALYYGKARCGECHKDTPARSAEDIGEAIATAMLVTVETNAGATYSGITRNEDNYSLQLQALDGTFYFIQKSQVKSIRREPAHASLPKLTPPEIDDIEAYLAGSGSS